MLALRLPPDLEARLDNLAKLTGRTKSFYAREAILKYIDDLEDLYIAQQRMSDDPQFVDFDEAMQELGLDLKEASGQS